MECKDIREKHSKEILFLAKENNKYLYLFLFYKHISGQILTNKHPKQIWSSVLEQRDTAPCKCIASTSTGILFCLVFQSPAETILTENAAQACQMSPGGEKTYQEKVTNACSLLFSHTTEFFRDKYQWDEALAIYPSYSHIVLKTVLKIR